MVSPLNATSSSRLLPALVAVLVAATAPTACRGGPAPPPDAGREARDAGERALRERRALEASMPPPAPATPASLHAWVDERARRLARIDHAPAASPAADALGDLTYDQYRSIAFRPEAALWRDEARFELQLVHPGFLYREPVRIHVVDDGRIGEIAFDDTLFHHGVEVEGEAADADPDIGHAGFRVYYPAGEASGAQEVAVFLGASYFRLLGGGQVHGLSGRGLAIDVPDTGAEEFPAFREFWLLRPAPEATVLTFFALLDGPSVTGAYRFDLEPGARTTLRVDARLHARADVERLGVAPLTSMYLYGPDRAREFDDFRPQVHDSDGLLVLTGAGEWIWRPLANRSTVRVTSLRDRAPRGFGLVQRDRDFDSYLDLEARYHRRPSAWVGTEGDGWEAGGVDLVEIPSTSEFNDNIVAYWAPDEPFVAGDERRYAYRVTTFGRRLDEQTLLQVERTRIGRDALPGQADAPTASRRRVVVDFGGAVSPGASEPGRVEAVAETSNGAIESLVVQPLPDGGGWRATFALVPDGERPADMRLFLEADGERLTETWSHVWYPDRAR